MSETQRYPLSWPTGWKRTSPASRRIALFGRGLRVETPSGSRPGPRRPLTVAEATARLSGEIERLGGKDPLLSTNMQVRLDGLPRSGQPEPSDPGAAVYFSLHGKPRCLACDRWHRVADNIAAIAAHVYSIRAVDRYGVGTMDQAFAGYAQLPPASVDWPAVLGVSRNATLADVEAAFLRLARVLHPDAGGSSNDMARLNSARDLARTEINLRG